MIYERILSQQGLTEFTGRHEDQIRQQKIIQKHFCKTNAGKPNEATAHQQITAHAYTTSHTCRDLSWRARLMTTLMTFIQMLKRLLVLFTKARIFNTHREHLNPPTVTIKLQHVFVLFNTQIFTYIFLFIHPHHVIFNLYEILSYSEQKKIF